MSKVDWVEAEVKYITKPEVSYDWIAQLFGAAKSTIVRHAVKEEWPKKRKEYKQKHISALEERILEKSADVDERHLKILRNTQTSFHNRILDLGLKQQRGEQVDNKAWRTIASLTDAMTKAIMAERAILGLPTKQIRITDPEALDNIQRQRGIKTDPSYQK